METLKKLLAIDLNYIIVVLMVVFYSLEQLLTTQFSFNKRPQHLMHNVLFQVVFLAINFFFAVFTVMSIEWLNEHEIGLFYLVQLPVWLKLLLGVAMFDFVTYWFHRLGHIIPVLWRFHRVHHSDTSMDATTYFRGHPIEVFLWFGLGNIVAAAVFGLDLTTLGLYFLVSTPFLIVEHSNIRFPVWIDKVFGYIFTTPNLHKIHHEQDQHYTDSNFADIFILWDRMFGTFKYKPVHEIHLGLKEFDEEKKQTFWYLMKSPFISIQRNQTNRLSEENNEENSSR